MPSRRPNKEDVDLGFRLRQKRQMKKYSLEELASIASISGQQLRKYELGRNRIPALRLSTLADKLDTDINELLGKGMNDTKEKLYSDMDREAIRLWMSIGDRKKKRILLLLLKLISNDFHKEKPKVNKKTK